MLPIKHQLVEVIRLLENKNHVFDSDPVPVTESLTASNKPMLERLIIRAQRIDSSQNIVHNITATRVRFKLILSLLALVWLVLGFFGLFALLQSASVNFFYVLVSVLGVHTLMLMLWLVTLVASKKDMPKSGVWMLVLSVFTKKSDTVQQSVTHSYIEQFQQPSMKWYFGKITHQMWLATLCGILVAIIFLLMVRQYHFNWQSTLLTPDILVIMVKVLSFLPEMVGFSVPSAEDVLQSQKLQQTAALDDAVLARKWSGLLIGSVLCYGIVPRLLAWVWCAYKYAKQAFSLPLQNSYYQALISGWSKHVVDADDMPEAVIPKAPEALVSQEANIAKLACLLETPNIYANWHENVLESSWQLFTHSSVSQGMLDSRENIQALIEHLQTHNSQLLIGIRAQALPDRGLLRKIDKIAQHAKGGVIIKLLSSDDVQENAATKQSVSEREQQWHEVLAQRNIALVTT